jgi:hypothetical protein
MMPTVHLTHLLRMLHRCAGTMDTVTLDPGIMAITGLGIMVTTGKGAMVTVVVTDIGGNESPPVSYPCLRRPTNRL